MSFQGGLTEAILGIVGSVIVGVVVAGFAEEGLIPSYVAFGFAIGGLTRHTL